MANWLARYVRGDPARYEEKKAALRAGLPVSDGLRMRVAGVLSGLHQKYFEDFVFIHIPKCGGTSVERALGVPLTNHDTALERRKKLGEARWARRVKFAVVRNPYARIASSFFYWRAKKDAGLDHWRNQFADWLQHFEIVHKEDGLEKPIKSQVWWTSDEQGAPLLDFTCRLEHIEEDLMPVTKALGRDIRLPKVNVNPHLVDYDQLHNERTRAMTREIYPEDFERFKYEV